MKDCPECGMPWERDNDSCGCWISPCILVLNLQCKINQKTDSIMKWIDAKKELPEMIFGAGRMRWSDKVLMRNEKHVFVGLISQVKGHDVEVNAFPEAERAQCDHITHWMPLPEPPKPNPPCKG